MAKAKEFPCDKPAADPHDWLAEVLLVRFDEVVGHRTAALEPNNIEGIHDMRVAVRRIRSVIRDFDQIIDKLPIKSLRKDLKALSDALGEVRDEDVAIAALQDFRNKSDSEVIRDGIDDRIVKGRQDRDEAFANLTELLAEREWLSEMRSHLEAALQKTRRQRELFRPMTITQAARDTVASRLADVWDRGHVIYEPSNDKALHKFRLRAKRLRYAIQLFAGCLDERVVAFAREVAKLQDHLGEMHDSDLWIEDLGAHLKTQTLTAVGEASAWLLSRFVKKRSKRYRAALDLWVDWERRDVLSNLKAAL